MFFFKKKNPKSNIILKNYQCHYPLAENNNSVHHSKAEVPKISIKSLFQNCHKMGINLIL